jgi:hypothetical protein
MATWKLQSEDGTATYTVSAPDHIPEAEVMAFAESLAPSWENGGHYAISTEDPIAPKQAAPAAATTPRNALADAKSAALRTRLAEVDRQITGTTTRQPAETEGGAVTGMGQRPDASPRLYNRAVLKAERDKLQAELDKYSVGDTGQTVGGIGGALVGGGLGLALGGPAAPITGTLGALAGGILGTGAGTHLYDIPAARESRDITDAEAAELIKDRMIQSAVVDGGFTLLFGPGGRVLGKVLNGSKIIPAIKASAKEYVEELGAAGVRAESDRVAGIVRKRAGAVPAGRATGVSDELGIPTGRTGQEAAESLIDDVRVRSGRIPTAGEAAGSVDSRLEGFVRGQAPAPFAQNARILAETAEQIRRDALRVLDDVGAATGPDLGNKIAEVVKSADTTLKRVTGPTFQAAAQANIRADMRATRDLLKKIMFDYEEAGGVGLGSTEFTALKKLLENVTVEPFMSMEGAQTLVSSLKAMERGMAGEAAAPSLLLKRIVHQVAKVTDDAFMAEVGHIQGNPGLQQELRKARELYRETKIALYGESMAAAASKNPEDVGRFLLSPGTVTEIRDMRAALNAALKNAPRKQIMKNGEVSEIGMVQLKRQRAAIDAGMVKGFIEKHTQSGSDLESRILDPDFKRTLKELLIGKGAANPALGKIVLRELDKTLGAQRMLRPDVYARPSTARLPGVSGQVGAGAAMGTATGAAAAGIPWLVIGTAGGMRLIANAAAHAMTTADVGVLRKIQRVIALSQVAGKNVAAAEAARAAFNELEQWDRETNSQASQ